MSTKCAQAIAEVIASKSDFEGLAMQEATREHAMEPLEIIEEWERDLVPHTDRPALLSGELEKQILKTAELIHRQRKALVSRALRAAITKPEAERVHQHILALAQPQDHWDRPGGDWGGHPRRPRSQVPRLRTDANSDYRIGSKALHRGEDITAEALLYCGLAAQHPGAAFRLLVAVARRSTAAQGRGRGHLLGMRALVRYLRRAAAWGHGDAQHLLTWLDSRAAGRKGEAAQEPTAYVPEDKDFYTEVHDFLYRLMATRPAAPTDSRGPSA
ncbi:hypothetical protein AB0B15_03040 [Streptomyces sp. NPDC045456]|uniref:hypothetical protein n=1 Tax=Streptomyces sp. NPDC045456 TaxID=3155254 RepID=UPI0033DA2CCC